MSEIEEFVVSNVNDDPEVLRERFRELGYLFIKNGIDADRCDVLAKSFVEALTPYVSWASDGRSLVSNGEHFGEGDGLYDELYPRLQSLEAFHDFFHEPAMIKLMEIVTGKKAFVYPIKMARIGTPGKIGFETPPHQDGRSHQGGPTMGGIWVPLLDVSAGMGRLRMLPGSHKRGIRPVFPARGPGLVQCEIYPGESTWHVSDVAQGDVLLFNSATVHDAEPNTTDNAVRLSVDTRFSDYGAPVYFSNLEPHHSWRIETLCWTTIYRGWNSTENQYYWKDYPNLV
ncbi:MAG: phytanoyl-CoA dioxygenase [Halieaceae bacterium]|jgi:ectoine hydroxylase-related dioxygenase (phytanoyl-CoA dioxygenase family)|nr:phytanoyl-CoA dioxygenase [Halieaceae bacterium]